jgi:hypothetical protein
MADRIDQAGRAIAGLLTYNPGPGIYSRLERAIQAMPENVRVQELPGLLKRYKDGVPGWELKETDLDSVIAGRDALLGTYRSVSPAAAVSAEDAAKLDALLARLSDINQRGEPAGSIAHHWGDMRAGEMAAKYPGFPAILRSTPAKHWPGAGTSIHSVDSRRLLGELAYPEDLRADALRRLGDSPYQRIGPGQTDWMYLRPARTVVPDTPGQAHMTGRRDDAANYTTVYDIGGTADAVIPILLHELRHGTNQFDFATRKAMPSVTSAYRTAKRGERMQPTLARDFQNYLARPTEMMSYIAEAGDDYVREAGRLIDSPAAADAAMEAWAANAASAADPMVRGFYDAAYRTSPRARALMRDMLLRYYAVPVAAGAAMEGQE